jgi:murein DD-endopeptidase MepM/ murein hydrolase activator NlpD
VGVTFALTSIFWIVLGGWFWHQHVAGDAAGPVASTNASVMGSAAHVPGSGLAIPVAGVAPRQLSDNFTQPRGGGARSHEALDIMAAEGTAVTAAAPGRVEKLFASKLGGTTIYQRSTDGRTIYYYAHLAGYAPGLAEGAQLKTGDPIGTVGHTGDADPAAPHLHFAVWQTSPERKWWDAATAVDPYPLLAGHDAGR